MFTLEQIAQLARAVSLDAYSNLHRIRESWKKEAKLRFAPNGEVRSNGRKIKRKWFFYSSSDMHEDKRAFSPRYVLDVEQAHRLRCQLHVVVKRLVASRLRVSEKLKEINGSPDTILWAGSDSPKSWSVLKLSPHGVYYFSQFLGEKAQKLSLLEQMACVSFISTPAGLLVQEILKLGQQLDNVLRLLHRCIALLDAQVRHIAKTTRPEGELTVIVRVRDEDFFVCFEERWPERLTGGEKHKVVFSRRVQDPIPVLPAKPLTAS